MTQADPGSTLANPEASPSQQAPGPDAGITATRTNPKWVRNMMIYVALCLGIGVWGLVDATVVYPNRGARAAEFFEFQYLDELARATGSVVNGSASVENPAEAFQRLKGKSTGGGQMTPVETNQYHWLEQLAAIGQMNPANTKFPRTDFRRVDGKLVEVASAGERLGTLRERWTKVDEKGNPPPYSPLSWYDLPSQWLFVVFGLGLAPYLLFTMLRVRARVYRFEHATCTLTLPTGESVAPADVKEFDKTKWDKVFITLHIRDDHPRLAGRSLELDLLRFVPLEDWVLRMEQVAGPRP